jgi:short-subunit dehydrogenase
MGSRLSVRYRTAFVTGASSGLGEAFAEMLVTEGVEVWASARQPERLAKLQARHPGQIHPVTLDLADGPGAEAALRRAAGEAGGMFELLVNNAGYGIFGEFGEIEPTLWEAQLSAMLGATLRLTQAAWRSWQERGRGTLVNVSSLAAEFPLPYMSGYNVAKAGLSALSESLMFEGRSCGIVVIDFRPGDYRTAFNRAMQTPVPASAAPPAEGLASAWRALEANLQSAPLPERAAADLRRALRRPRSGIVRSGAFFQTVLAPLGARLLPVAALRAASAKYFGSP